VADSLNIEVGEVRKRYRGSAFIEHPREQSLSSDSDHLKVEQFWRDETFTSKAFTARSPSTSSSASAGAITGRVNDDHLASRSSRTASLAKRYDTMTSAALTRSGQQIVETRVRASSTSRQSKYS